MNDEGRARARRLAAGWERRFYSELWVDEIEAALTAARAEGEAAGRAALQAEMDAVATRQAKRMARAIRARGPEGRGERENRERLIAAAAHTDWVQVVLNQEPPCFYLEEDGRFCLRAERWTGHGGSAATDHEFVSLAALLAALY